LGVGTSQGQAQAPQGAPCCATRLDDGVRKEGNAIRVERVVSPDVLMGQLAGHRLVEALEKDRQADRRR
jgi:hypothetical protein